MRCMYTSKEGEVEIEAGYGEALVSNMAVDGLEVAGGGKGVRLHIPKALHLVWCVCDLNVC